MEWAALIAWVVTAGGGVVLLARWLQNGGRQHRYPPLLVEAMEPEEIPLPLAGVLAAVA